MSISPILPGRVPSTLIGSRVTGQLATLNSILVDLQDQVATGQRFQLPGESPAAAIRSIYLQKSIERKEQMQVNINTDEAFLNVSESRLQTVSEALNRAKSIALTGVGSTVSDAEKQALATEVKTLLDGVLNAANASSQGRYLFAGSQTGTLPFEGLTEGVVRYNGDTQSISSFLDLDLISSNNVDGNTAFAALTPPTGTSVDPALTLETRITELNGGRGAELGLIEVTIDDTVNPVEVQQIDLTGAQTIGDIKTRIENAFAAGPPTVTVEIDPASNSGIRITPSGGTVAVADLANGRSAAELGIRSPAVAQVNGSDLDPRLTLQTPLSAFNNGAGIGPTAGNGLQIINGPINATVDISAAVTVGDLFNTLEAANLSLSLGINEDGTRLSISSRLSGADFSIGENNGTNATGLGIRTFTGSTQLSQLNLGEGVPLERYDTAGNLMPAEIEIHRRDGTISTVDLKGLETVQQVLDAITAVDADLTASLNTVGNGISITDASGVGPLSVADGEVAAALGIVGEEPGADPLVPLNGSDPNPIRAEGVISLLAQLETALRTGDDVALQRIDRGLDAEISRFTLVRGDVGSRLKLMDDVRERLLDEDIALEEALSKELDADLTEIITQSATVTQVLEATLSIASQTMQLSLTNFL